MELIDYCELKLKNSGASSLKTFNNSKTQANLFSTINGENPIGMGIVLSGHTDVVPPGNIKDWTINPFKPVVKKNYLFGRGANDMKSSIAWKKKVRLIHCWLGQNNSKAKK